MKIWNLRVQKNFNIEKIILCVLRGLFDPQMTFYGLEFFLSLSKWHETLYGGKPLLDLKKNSNWNDILSLCSCE